jgi:hypothetical protein
MSDVIIPVEQDNKTKPKPHKKSKLRKSRSITKTEVSPNGKYVVTYSKNDCSIVLWSIKDVEGRLEPEPDFTVKTGNKRVTKICISDDRKLAYIYDLSDVNVSKLGKQYFNLFNCVIYDLRLMNIKFNLYLIRYNRYG